MSDFLADHFKNNEDTIVYASRVGKVNMSIIIKYKMNTPMYCREYSALYKASLIDVVEPIIISQRIVAYAEDTKKILFSEVVKAASDMFEYIRDTRLNMFPLAINENSIRGDIARAIMSGKLKKNHLYKNVWDYSNV